MRMEIILENFQGTSHADLVFDEGLTIIRGLNNQGKSSLRRALEAVIFNNPRKVKNYIKNGTKQCSVTIKVEGYKDITWIKNKKGCSYLIDNQPFENAGRLSLKDVYPDNPFTLHDNNILFNVIKQGKKPIPFDGQTSSQVFGIFEELYGVLSTKEDITKFNTKLSEYNTQLVQNNRVINSLENKLKVIKNFKESVNPEKLKVLKNKLSNTQDTLNKVNRVIELKKILDTNTVIPIPILSSTLSSSINQLREIKKIKELKEFIDNKKTLKPPVDSNLFKELKSLKEILQIKSELVSLKLKLSNSKQRILEIKKLLPVCPTCKRPF